jgi:hypothetical protein
MTVKQIAELTGKSIHTIIRNIKKQFPGKQIENGIPIELTEFEAFMVLKSFHPGYELEPPSQNAKLPSHPAKLPNGSQLRELRLLTESGFISPAHLRLLLGLFPGSLGDEVRKRRQLKIEDGSQGRLFPA